MGLYKMEKMAYGSDYSHFNSLLKAGILRLASGVMCLWQKQSWNKHLCKRDMLALQGRGVILFTLTFFFLRPAQIHQPLSLQNLRTVCISSSNHFLLLFYFSSSAQPRCSATSPAFEQWYKYAWLAKASQHSVHLLLML